MRDNHFFSWIPGVIAGGPLLTCGVILLEGNNLAAGCILLGVGILTAFLLCWHCHFYAEKLVFWQFGIFPTHIHYAEIIHWEDVLTDRNHPEVPTSMICYLRNGSCNVLGFGSFPWKIRRRIAEELRSIAESGGEAEFRELFRHAAPRFAPVLRAGRIERMMMGCCVIFFGVMSGWGMLEQMRWDNRIREWENVPAIVLQNEIQTIRNGKSTRRKTVMLFRYSFQGREYQGNRIVYDSSSFPSCPPGTVRRCIVNPENPADAAILFRYIGYGWILRYGTEIGFGAMSLAFLAGLLLSLRKRLKPEDFQKIDAYLQTIPDEVFAQALTLRGAPFSRLAVSCGGSNPKWVCREGRFGEFKRNTFNVGTVVMTLILLLLLFSGIPLMQGFTVVLLCFFAIRRWKRKDVVFDFQERRIFFKRLNDANRSGKESSIDFDDLTFLWISRTAKAQMMIVLHRKNAPPIPLAHFSGSRLKKLVGLLPELAEKLGRLPVVIG